MQLSSCYLFEGLSESQLNDLITIGIETSIQKDQWIFQEGEDTQQIYVLKKGAVELLTTVDGIELPITILRSPADCFGASALVKPYKYSLSARGVEDGSLLAFNRVDLEKLIKQDHELGCIVQANLAKHFLERLKETRQELKIHFKTIFKSMHH
jgi:CRP/FNR family cyclic AMP-dependent transcriptional regulator